jgi:hypothetical protein
MQHNLALAVRDPEIKMPPRFNIYRNNHWVSVLNAMKASFPMTLRLVGDGYFTQISRAFLEAHPPSSRLMMELGEGFPEFLQNRSTDLPYLKDFAKLEVLRTQSYHAADAPALTPSDFADVQDFEALSFTFHPSMRLLASEYPVFSIYNDLTSGIFEGGCEGVIIREDYEINTYPADINFLEKLAQGAKLGYVYTDQQDTLTLILQKGLTESFK